MSGTTIAIPAEYEVCIKCLICDNYKHIEPYEHKMYVCDECKEAIKFAKELMRKNHGE